MERGKREKEERIFWAIFGENFLKLSDARAERGRWIKRREERQFEGWKRERKREKERGF